MINYTSLPFIDADGDPLTLTQTGLPAPLSFADNGDGTYTVTGNAPAGGPWTVFVTADDAKGGIGTQTLTIDCGTVNQLPIAPADVTIDCGAGNALFFSNGGCNLTGQQGGGSGTENCGVGPGTGQFPSGQKICGLPVLAIYTRQVFDNSVEQFIIRLDGALSQSDWTTVTLNGGPSEGGPITLTSASAGGFGTMGPSSWVWDADSGNITHTQWAILNAILTDIDQDGFTVTFSC